MTAKVKNDILEALELGMSLADALSALEVSHTAYVRAKQGDEAFGRGVKGAAARGKLYHLRRVHEGGRNWQASAWYLERRYGAEYGNRLKLDHTGLGVRVVEEVVTTHDAAADGHANGAAPPRAAGLPPQ